MHRPTFSRARHLLAAALVAAFGCGDQSTSVEPDPEPTTYTISGTVQGSQGATVHLTGAASQETVVSAGGAFEFVGLAPGTYTVSPAEDGAVFDPVARDVTVGAADVTAVSFVRGVPDEGIPSLVLDRIDDEPETWIPPTEVVLPNGRTLAEYLAERGFTGPAPSAAPSSAADDVTGPQQRKNDIVARMVAGAQDLACARATPACTKWNFPADPSNPKRFPAQTGLTYVYGGKDPSVRTRPVDGCPEETFGVDCSGLVSLVAAQAGLTAPAGSAAQSDPANWPLPEEWKLEFKAVDDGSIETGDIVAWNGHIGIAQTASEGGTASIISSTGAPGQCVKNVQAPRGPRSLTVAQLGLGAPSVVLRLVTTLSGTFDLYLRCSDQQTDALVIRFTLDNDAGGPFEASGDGTDYDGTPFNAVLAGEYDQISNIVDATLTIPSFSRQDAFSRKLREDDTGYFPLTKVQDNGGCEVSARLVRVEDPSAPVGVAPVHAPATGAANVGSLLRGGPGR